MLQEDDLKQDVVVLGSGLVETMAAAALARAGKKVLHLDSRDYYGGNTCSLGLKQFREWSTKEHVCTNERFIVGADSRGDFVTLPGGDEGARLFYDREFEIMQPQDPLLKDNFSIDLVPRLIYSKSDSVDVLRESSVHRYLEFQGLKSTQLYEDSDFRSVPLSKGEIFQDSQLTLMQKRLLMKFLNKFLETSSSLAFQSAKQTGYDDQWKLSGMENADEAEMEKWKEVFQFDDETKWNDTLKKQKLKGFLANMLTYAVCFSDFGNDENLTTKDALGKIKKFVTSLHLYSNHCLLFPMYGSADIVQAFSRLCAVHQGIYMLTEELKSVYVGNEDTGNEAEITGVVTSKDQFVQCKHLIISPDYLPFTAYQSETRAIRGVLITKSQVLPESGLRIAFFPPEGKNFDNVVQLLQTDFNCGTCPVGCFVTYLSQARTDDSKDNLTAAMDLLVEKVGSDNVLAKGTYVHRARQASPNRTIDDEKLPQDFTVFVEDPMPCPQMLQTTEVTKARDIFRRIMGTEDGFLAIPDHVKKLEEEEKGKMLGNFTSDLAAASGDVKKNVENESTSD
eukprot:gene713-60_t